MKILKISIIVFMVLSLSALYMPISYATINQTAGIGQGNTIQKSAKKLSKHAKKKIRKQKKVAKPKKERTDEPASPGDNQQGLVPEATVGVTHTILIQDFAFSPNTITIKKGDTVEFIQKDSIGHTVSTDPHPAHTQLPDFSSSVLSLNQKYSYTFTKVGTWTYHCSPHPTMTGTVVVTE